MTFVPRLRSLRGPSQVVPQVRAQVTLETPHWHGFTAYVAFTSQRFVNWIQPCFVLFRVVAAINTAFVGIYWVVILRINVHVVAGGNMGRCSCCCRCLRHRFVKGNLVVLIRLYRRRYLFFVIGIDLEKVAVNGMSFFFPEGTKMSERAWRFIT